MYRAAAHPWRPGDPQAVAVKLLRWRWHRRPEAWELFRREAQLGMAISHPHLAAVLEVGLSTPPRYLVLEWLDGEPLADLIEQRGPLDWRWAVHAARQLAEALDAVHRSGWRHADVKPANVLVSPAGNATLTDLGLAQPIDAARGSNLPLAGTPSYLAPELLGSGDAIDGRTDLYALGVLLYECLVGHVPFAGGSLLELARLHREQPPVDVCRLRTELPAQVSTVVNRLLAKCPEQRPQSAREAAELLAGCLPQLGPLRTADVARWHRAAGPEHRLRASA